MIRIMATRGREGDVEATDEDDVQTLLAALDDQASEIWRSKLTDATEQRRTSLRCVGIRVHGVTYHEQEIEAFEFDLEYDPRL